MFDGLAKAFQLWWMRFVIFSIVYKFGEAVNKEAPDANLPSSEDDVLDEDDKKKIAAKRRNSVAMANLSMAFTSEASMGLIYKSMSKEWPNGLTHLVIKALFKKYHPDDTISKVELRQRLNGVTMKSNADPATLFEQLASIKNRYNTLVDQLKEEDLIAVVLEKAPMEYQAVLTTEQRARGSNLTLDDLEMTMNQHWRQIGDKSKSAGETGGKEIALSAVNKIVCFNDGEEGHKASNCPNNGKRTKKGRQRQKGQMQVLYVRAGGSYRQGLLA
jgi:hypothetical protein